MKCYFGADDVETCIAGTRKPGDPFHPDPTLKQLSKPVLGITAFGGTGHDRGHLAPNQSFSWHICGAYRTFTMANMAPQLAELNRGLWADLDAGGLPGKVVKPTGFYKVIFRPGAGGSEDRAIAFLVPHTRSKMAAHYRQFVARMDLVEETAGFAFSAPDALKGAGGQQWWLDRPVPKNWMLRAKTCDPDSAREGWQPELSKSERTDACRLSD